MSEDLLKIPVQEIPYNLTNHSKRFESAKQRLHRTDVKLIVKQRYDNSIKYMMMIP